jgi:hypothetical protein
VERAEGRDRAALVQPCQQVLEVAIRRERLGLVDEAQPRAEAGDQHAASTAVTVAGAVELNERSRVARSIEGGADRVPVGAQALQELRARVDPLLQAAHDLPREHGVLLQERQGDVRLTETSDERLEALLR